MSVVTSGLTWELIFYRETALRRWESGPDFLVPVLRDAYAEIFIRNLQGSSSTLDEEPGRSFQSAFPVLCYCKMQKL